MARTKVPSNQEKQLAGKGSSNRNKAKASRSNVSDANDNESADVAVAATPAKSRKLPAKRKASEAASTPRKKVKAVKQDDDEEYDNDDGDDDDDDDEEVGSAEDADEASFVPEGRNKQLIRKDKLNVARPVSSVRLPSAVKSPATTGRQRGRQAPARVVVGASVETLANVPRRQVVRSTGEKAALSNVPGQDVGGGWCASEGACRIRTVPAPRDNLCVKCKLPVHPSGCCYSSNVGGSFCFSCVLKNYDEAVDFAGSKEANMPCTSDELIQLFCNALTGKGQSKEKVHSVAAAASPAASRSPRRGKVTERRSSPKNPSTFGNRRGRRRIVDEDEEEEEEEVVVGANAKTTGLDIDEDEEEEEEEVVVGANAKTTGLDIDEAELVEVQEVTALSDRTVNPTSSPRAAVPAQPKHRQRNNPGVATLSPVAASPLKVTLKVRGAPPGSTVGQTAQPMVSPPNPAVGTKGKVSAEEVLQYAAASPQPVAPLQPTEPITPASLEGGSFVVPNNPVSSNNPVSLPDFSTDFVLSPDLFAIYVTSQDRGFVQQLNSMQVTLKRVQHGDQGYTCLTGVELLNIFQNLFGSDRSFNRVAKLVYFLQVSYVHKACDDLVTICNFEVKVRKKQVSIVGFGLNTIHILLSPQLVDDGLLDEATLLQLHEETSVQQFTSKQDFIWRSATMKTVEKFEDKSCVFSNAKPISSWKNIKGLNERKWLIINDTTQLPFMYMLQPVGYEWFRGCCSKNKKAGIDGIFIHLTLLPPVNQRRILSKSEAKISLEKGSKESIVLNMLADSLGSSSEGKMVDSTPMMLHPFRIGEAVQGLSPSKHDADDGKQPLCLESPFTDVLTGTSTSSMIANEFGCTRLSSDEMVEVIKKFTQKSSMQDVFSNMPTEADIVAMGDSVYSILLFINFKELIHSHFNGFQNLECYGRLAVYLLKIVREELNDVPISIGILAQRNIFHYCRVFFRFLFPKLGVMIPEGNESLPANNECKLGVPSFSYLHRTVSCDYIVPKIITTQSEQAYTASQASARISAHQFADKYMQNFGAHLRSNLPYGMLEKWPQALLGMVQDWETRNKSKQSLQDFLFEKWLISNKCHFFESVFQQDEIFDIAFDSSTIFKKREDFLEHLQSRYAHENNMTSDMNAFPFVASMSVMLVGLACGTRDEQDSVSVNEIQKLVSSNGITVVQDADESVLTRTLMPADINVRGKVNISWDNFCGFLPSKHVHMEKSQFPIFARAFAALLYAPSVAMCLVLAKHVHIFSGKNVSISYLQNRCIFSSYCDVVTVYNKFGPILPVPTFFNTDENYSYMKMFYELMTMDVFCRSASASSSRENKKPFHSYGPGGITIGSEPMDHLSSNVPNFVSLICLAMHLYELNDSLYRKAVKNKVDDPLSNLLFPLMDDDSYIVLTNKNEIRKLFDKRGSSNQPSSEPVGAKNEKYFRDTYLTNKGLLQKEFTTLCYVKDVKLKFMFVKVCDWKSKKDYYKHAITYSLVELCEQVFNENCEAEDGDDCPLCNMDSSFDLIVEYFRSDYNNLVEFLRIPTKIIEDSKTTNSLVSRIFHEDGAGGAKGSKKKAAESSIISKRGKAVSFLAQDKKMFESAMKFFDSELYCGKGLKPVNLVSAGHESALTCAKFHCEKMLGFMLLAFARQTTESVMSAKDLETANKLLKSNAIFDNLTNSIVKCFDSFFSESTTFKKIAKSLRKEKKIADENQQNDFIVKALLESSADPDSALSQRMNLFFKDLYKGEADRNSRWMNMLEKLDHPDGIDVEAEEGEEEEAADSESEAASFAPANVQSKKRKPTVKAGGGKTTKKKPRTEEVAVQKSKRVAAISTAKAAPHAGGVREKEDGDEEDDEDDDEEADEEGDDVAGVEGLPKPILDAATRKLRLPENAVSTAVGPQRAVDLIVAAASKPVVAASPLLEGSDDPESEEEEEEEKDNKEDKEDVVPDDAAANIDKEEEDADEESEDEEEPDETGDSENKNDKKPDDKDDQDNEGDAEPDGGDEDDGPANDVQESGNEPGAAEGEDGGPPSSNNANEGNVESELVGDDGQIVLESDQELATLDGGNLSQDYDAESTEDVPEDSTLLIDLRMTQLSQEVAKELKYERISDVSQNGISSSSTIIVESWKKEIEPIRVALTTGEDPSNHMQWIVPTKEALHKAMAKIKTDVNVTHISIPARVNTDYNFKVATRNKNQTVTGDLSRGNDIVVNSRFLDKIPTLIHYCHKHHKLDKFGFFDIVVDLGHVDDSVFVKFKQLVSQTLDLYFSKQDYVEIGSLFRRVVYGWEFDLIVDNKLVKKKLITVRCCTMEFAYCNIEEGYEHFVLRSEAESDGERILDFQKLLQQRMNRAHDDSAFHRICRSTSMFFLENKHSSRHVVVFDSALATKYAGSDPGKLTDTNSTRTTDDVVCRHGQLDWCAAGRKCANGTCRAEFSHVCFCCKRKLHPESCGMMFRLFDYFCLLCMPENTKKLDVGDAESTLPD